jgi:hypothetical protein
MVNIYQYKYYLIKFMNSFSNFKEFFSKVEKEKSSLESTLNLVDVS